MARILGVDDNLTLQETETELRPDAEDYSDIGTLQSIFAGLGSGLNTNTKRCHVFGCKCI